MEKHSKPITYALIDDFRKATFETDQVYVTAGKSTKRMPMETRRVQINGKAVLFALIRSRADWLHKAISQSSATGRSRMARIQLLRDVHGIAKKAYAGEFEEETAPDEDADLSDPMNDVDDEDFQTPTKTCGRGVKRTHRGKKPCGKVVQIDFPLECPEANPDCKDKCAARFYVIRKSQIWLQLDDVNRARKYMYAQYVLQGVAHVASDDVGPSTPPKRRGVKVD